MSLVHAPKAPCTCTKSSLYMHQKLLVHHQKLLVHAPKAPCTCTKSSVYMHQKLRVHAPKAPSKVAACYLAYMIYDICMLADLHPSEPDRLLPAIRQRLLADCCRLLLELQQLTEEPKRAHQRHVRQLSQFASLLAGHNVMMLHT
jgi:hypothetical protein